MSIHTITNPNSIKKVRYVDDKSNQLVLRVDEHDYCDRIDNMILSTIQNHEKQTSEELENFKKVLIEKNIKFFLKRILEFLIALVDLEEKDFFLILWVIV